jgi:hypothetical protein
VSTLLTGFPRETRLLTRLWIQLRFTTSGVRSAQAKYRCAQDSRSGITQPAAAAPMCRR